MRVLLLLCLGLSLPSPGKTLLITFTGYGVSPSGEGCGGRGEYPAGASFPGHGMTEITATLENSVPAGELVARTFTYFNEGMGLACSTPLDGEADHTAAAAFVERHLQAGDRVILAGHSYGGHRALLFAAQFQRSYGRPADAVVLADPIDWTRCSIREILGGGRISDCRQNTLTVFAPPEALRPESVWVFRQERGYRLRWIVWPILLGYNVQAGDAPAQTTVLRALHSDVDNTPEVLSLLEELVRYPSGRHSVTNSASSPTVSQ